MNDRRIDLTKEEERHVKRLVDRWMRMKIKRQIKKIFIIKRNKNAVT